MRPLADGGNLEAWDVAKRPQFKEYMITHNIVGALEQAARAAPRD
jgi:hypothetical protein